MKYTCAQAAKLLKQLNEDYDALIMTESQSSTFLASLGEDIESVRPKYDFKETQTMLNEYEGKIRALKHAINIFNTTHIVSGFDMNIDEMLVYIPQLTRAKNRLYMMKSALPKVRESISGMAKAAVIDYRYANYDVPEAQAEYQRVSDLLSRAQTALDLINNTETLEIEL
ncbi:MAG: hypothetical protein GX061_00255 [Eubacteriaceae bacterium]|nr:hypothetical protein [Eubacteriaceae bacterium]